MTEHRGRNGRTGSRKRQKEQEKRLALIVKIAAFCILLAVVLWQRYDERQMQNSTGNGETGSVNVGDGKLNVYYLDVGQADCTILESEGEALVIDAGNNDDGDLIVDFLRNKGIQNIKYAIGSHSHEDHVGALDVVLKEIQTEHVILPEEDSETRTYRDVLAAIEEQNVDLIRPEVGAEYSFGKASFQILAPSDGKKSSANHYSVGVMVTFGETKFLFTGDAEEAQEEEMLLTGLPLECDVYKAGHHGSSTSNTLDFVRAADPTWAVISCGEGNSYGHPHAEVVAEFEDEDIQMYRTDRQGTIMAVSDGKDIHWEVEKRD